jgi:hypothetical protein
MSEPEPPEPTPVAAPVPGLPEPALPAPVPAGERPEYEFNEAQNAVINDLAMSIVWVRVPLLIVGVFQGIIAIGLAFRIPQDGAHIIGVFGHGMAALVCFLLANWLLRAAAAFARVTTTTSRDISNLMTGLKKFARWLMCAFGPTRRPWGATRRRRTRTRGSPVCWLALASATSRCPSSATRSWNMRTGPSASRGSWPRPGLSSSTAWPMCPARSA